MTGEEMVLALLIIIVVVLLYTCADCKPKCSRRRKKNKEDFTPSMPNTATAIASNIERTNDLKDLEYSEGYDQVAQYMALEAGVFESHAQYAAEHRD